MKNNTTFTMLVLLSAALLFSGCAGKPFPANTKFIGEVATIATPTEIKEGVNSYQAQLSPGNWLGEACGYNENMPENSAVILRVFHYWHNTASGMVRPGLFWAMADRVPVEQGNLVEMELIPGVADRQCPRIVKVRGVSLEDSHCEYRRNEKGGFAAAFDAINPVGGSGSASIYCEGLEKEGWQKAEIGPYGAFSWTKEPAGK